MSLQLQRQTQIPFGNNKQRTAKASSCSLFHHCLRFSCCHSRRESAFCPKRHNCSGPSHALLQTTPVGLNVRGPLITAFGADIIIAVQFIIGAAAGLFIGLLMLRSQLTWRTGLVIASVTGIVLELAIGTVAWVSFHQDIRWLSPVAVHSALVMCTTTIGTAIVTSALVKAAKVKTAATSEGKP